MPRKIYKDFGSDIISFLKKVGNNDYIIQSRKIKALYKDEKGDLYIRNYKSTGKRYIRVKHSKNKKVGLYVVI